MSMFSDRPLFSPLDLLDLEGVAVPSTPLWGTMAPHVRRGWGHSEHIVAPISSSIGERKTQPRCRPVRAKPEMGGRGGHEPPEHAPCRVADRIIYREKKEIRGSRSACARTPHVRTHTRSQGPFAPKRPFADFRGRGASSSQQQVTFTASPARSPLPLRLPKSPWASSRHG